KMKVTRIMLFLNILLFVSFFQSLQAQEEVENPQEVLVENEWYLIKVAIDEEEYPFIANEEIEQVILNFNYDSEEGVYLFSPAFCESVEWSLLFINENEFSTTFETSLDYTWCTDADNIYYDNFYYLGGFWSNQEENPFEIHITQEEDYKSLIIIGHENDKAYYQNVPYLSVKNQEKQNLVLYPNPAQEEIYIENLTATAEIEIYTISGKKLLQQQVNSSTESINISNLSAGIYLYRFKQNGKKIKTGKLIKE